MLCGSPAYLQEHVEPQSLDELRSHRLLVPGEFYLPPEWRNAPSHAARERLWSVCEDVNLLVALLRTGAGLGLLWEETAREHIERGDLVTLTPLIRHEPRALSMIHLSRDYLPRRVEVFLEFFRRRFRLRST